MGTGFVLGLLVGFPIAASPGPMFFLVLRRTLSRGWFSGFVSGLGIATGDAVYAAIAAFGISALINLLVAERRWIGLAGGLAIAIIGVRTLLGIRDPLPNPPRKGEGESRSHKGEGEGKGEGRKDYATTLALTLSNPPTILSFIAVFAGLDMHVGTGWPPAVGLVVGVMLGSALWWVLLTAVIAVVRTRVSPRVTRGLAIVAGLALIVFGAFITLQAL